MDLEGVSITIEVDGKEFTLEVDDASNVILFDEHLAQIATGSFNQPYYGSWMIRWAGDNSPMGAAENLRELIEVLASNV